MCSPFSAVAGDDQYAESSSVMKYAVRDADAVAESFCVRGGDLYESINLISLRNDHVTAQCPAQTVRLLTGQARPQDTVFAFLSDNGVLFDTGQSRTDSPPQTLTRNPFAFPRAIERLGRANSVRITSRFAHPLQQHSDFLLLP